MKKKEKKLKKIVLIPDQHIPYNDKLYWALLQAVMKDFKPDTSIILGDFADFYSVSSHDKDPKRQATLDKEIEETRKHLKDVVKFGASENVFIQGNHEYRLERHLMKESPQLYNVLSQDGKDPTQNLLNLDILGFKYIPYRQSYKIGKLYATHDFGTAGRYAHYKAGDLMNRNVVIGHTHAIGYAVNGNADGERHFSAMFGWGGDYKQIDYMHYAKTNKDWSLGFGIGYIDDRGNVFCYPIPVVNYSCVVEGKYYSLENI